ncbi:DapH/DapD/GlmU-related protein [Microbacterium barkeri]|uniref:DapH/DapD/GlmU-related protein n=1 Tax=Microbacterium barkeri TaxID=33917 RepID=UPI0030155D66
MPSRRNFRPPLSIDYGERLVIGDRTFINADFLVVGGGPVTIGSRVWLGGPVTITPGVTIGDDAIVGAGSVVPRDIPAGVVAVGNPCRPVREITTARSAPGSAQETADALS